MDPPLGLVYYNNFVQGAWRLRDIHSSKGRQGVCGIAKCSHERWSWELCHWRCFYRSKQKYNLCCMFLLDHGVFQTLCIVQWHFLESILCSCALNAPPHALPSAWCRCWAVSHRFFSIMLFIIISINSAIAVFNLDSKWPCLLHESSDCCACFWTGCIIAYSTYLFRDHVQIINSLAQSVTM